MKKYIRKHNEEKLMRDNDLGVFSKETYVATIYIGNLSYTVDEDQLKDIFSTYGEVSYIRLMRDSETNRSKGFAFIQMPSKLEAKEAVKNLDGAVQHDRTLKVSFAKDNPRSRKQRMSDRDSKITNVAKVEEVKQTKVYTKRKPKGLDRLFDHLKNS